MAVYRLNRHFRGYQGVCMSQQSCTNTKDGAANLLIPNIVAYHGDAGMQRLVNSILSFGSCTFCETFLLKSQ